MVAIRILDPEKAKAKALAKVAQWKRDKKRKEIEDKRKAKELENKKPEAEEKLKPAEIKPKMIDHPTKAEPEPPMATPFSPQKWGKTVFGSPPEPKTSEAKVVCIPLDLLKEPTQAELDKKLIEASKSGTLLEVDKLLCKGADAEPKTYKNLLFRAAQAGGCSGIVSLVLDKGINVNIQDDNGETALMKAAWRGDQATVVVLLQKGADPDIKDNNGHKASWWAELNENKKMAKFLKSKESKWWKL